jgi:hypothetical protein
VEKEIAPISRRRESAQRVGHPRKSLMERGFSSRTGVGAIRSTNAVFAFFGAFPQGFGQAFPPALRKSDFREAGVDF